MTRIDHPAATGALVAGTYLRALRQDRGLPLAHTAAVLGETITTAHEIETGQLCPDEVMVNDLLQAYGVASQDDAQGLMRLLDDAAHEREISHDSAPGWLSRLAACHRSAHTIVTYSAAFIPRFLRTPAYASHLLTTPRGELRPNSTATDAPSSAARRSTPIVVVLDESVLMRAVGSPALMRDQLNHVLEATADGTLRLSVLPLTTPVAPAVSTLTELWLSRRRLYVEEAHGVLYTADPQHSTARHQLLHTALAHSLSPTHGLDRLRQARDAFATASPTGRRRPSLSTSTEGVLNAQTETLAPARDAVRPRSDNHAADRSPRRPLARLATVAVPAQAGGHHDHL